MRGLAGRRRRSSGWWNAWRCGLRFGFYHSGWRSFRYRRAALLTEVPVQIQRPLAETAEHRSWLGDRPQKRFLQRFVVDFHHLVAEAGACRLWGNPSVRSHQWSGRDFQWDRRRPLRWRRRSSHRGRWGRRPILRRRSHGRRWHRGISTQGRRCGGRRGRKEAATLKAEAHPLRNTRMAFGTSQHTFGTHPIGFSTKTPTAY